MNDWDLGTSLRQAAFQQILLAKTILEEKMISQFTCCEHPPQFRGFFSTLIYRSYPSWAVQCSFSVLLANKDNLVLLLACLQPVWLLMFPDFVVATLPCSQISANTLMSTTLSRLKWKPNRKKKQKNNPSCKKLELSFNIVEY